MNLSTEHPIALQPQMRIGRILAACRSALKRRLHPGSRSGSNGLGLVRRVTYFVNDAVLADAGAVDLVVTLTWHGQQAAAPMAIKEGACVPQDVARAALREFVAGVTLAELLTERSACEANLCRVVAQKSCNGTPGAWRVSIRSVTVPAAFEAVCGARQLRAMRECVARHRH